MSSRPIITFKAGKCELDTSVKPSKVKPDATPGYISMYEEDEMLHFTWRVRNRPMTEEAELDLVIFPGDAHFVPYEYQTTVQSTSKTNGRIVALKFESSSSRHLFWLQSKPQKPDPSTFSERDTKIVNIVETLMQGGEVDLDAEIAQYRSSGGDADGDQQMEDAEEPREGPRSGAGGAGANATGADIRDDGAGAREGGADGGRAPDSGPTDASTIVQNFLNSLKAGGSGGQQQADGQAYTTLLDLLPSSVTIPTIDSATPAQLDNLLNYLPPTVLLLAQESAAQIDGMVEPDQAAASAALEALSVHQKKDILKRVLRSPQFHQSLGSLTSAIRDGGLPSIAAALGLDLQDGGLVRGGSVPLGGGDAVEAFVEGVRRSVSGKK